ncbi:M20 aminoacylase family protein [Devosia ginsengisoli]|uniref:Amidohydrolase n=1 Tax=Devosia ginsengisoli TaxID=400770 RepID=A0A5B8LWQ1_9HYPH|nr:M20 aminoacylase family protein [Devosia ginsengisoli]QDZ11922.1 amidohydrolase [Devosia ginsengisoli]
MSPADYFQTIEGELIDWRHLLHQHPELAYQEHWTADFIAEQLTRFGYAPHRGLGGTGVVASITRGEGPSIGLRADMDALPVEQQTGLPYASLNAGCMHACGHDGHVVMLLAAARWFAEHGQFSGTINFIFQPAEEGEAGAAAMLRDGLFETFPMREVYGLHNWPGLPEGQFAGRVGAQMAAFDTFEITLAGRGAHAAMPHMGQDVLLAAAHIQSQLQSIVARSVDPLQTAVVSVTQIHGGDSWNVLPADAVLRGCTRHLDAEVQQLIRERMAAVVAGVADSFGISAKLHYQPRYPATINTAREVGIAMAAAADVAGDDNAIEPPHPSMASEDFAFMLQQRPGAYLWLGAGSTNDGRVLHSARFDFNDRILTTGARWWVALALRALAD